MAHVSYGSPVTQQNDRQKIPSVAKYHVEHGKHLGHGDIGTLSRIKEEMVEEVLFCEPKQQFVARQGTGNQ